MAGATFKVTAAEDVYLKAGNAAADEAKFTDVFLKSFRAFNTSTGGKAMEGAYLGTLGRDFVGYPSDITNTPTSQQAAALDKWQAGDAGKLEKFTNDVNKRLTALLEAR